GDQLAHSDRDALIATAFLALGPASGANGEKARYDELDDALSATSSVFLGLTMGCARCHDHKTDPIPQRDYYRFLAVFAALEKRPTPLGPAEEQAKIDSASAARNAEISELRKRSESLQNFERDLREEDEIPPADFVGPPAPSRWYRAREREIENI